MQIGPHRAEIKSKLNLANKSQYAGNINRTPFGFLLHDSNSSIRSRYNIDVTFYSRSDHGNSLIVDVMTERIGYPNET